jgi:hypothetical protein
MNLLFGVHYADIDIDSDLFVKGVSLSGSVSSIGIYHSTIIGTLAQSAMTGITYVPETYEAIAQITPEFENLLIINQIVQRIYLSPTVLDVGEFHSTVNSFANILGLEENYMASFFNKTLSLDATVNDSQVVVDIGKEISIDVSVEIIFKTILNKGIIISGDLSDIDIDYDALQVVMRIIPTVETKQTLHSTVEANVYQWVREGCFLLTPITFPLLFTSQTFRSKWTLPTLEECIALTPSYSQHLGYIIYATINLVPDYADSVWKYIQSNIHELSYLFESNPLLVIADVFHKLEFSDDEFEQILLETGIEVDIIRYGSHVVEETVGIFQFISFDYTFSTVDDLGPYDAVLFLQDGHQLKRNDIIRYEGEYFSIVYNSMEKIGRHTLYVVYGLKRMTDYGLGINITVT